MAKVTDKGVVFSSGKGTEGARTAVKLLDVWVSRTMPREIRRLAAIKRKDVRR